MRALWVMLGLFLGGMIGVAVGVFSAYPVADLVGIQGYEGPAYFLPGFAVVCGMVGAASGCLTGALVPSKRNAT